MPDVQATDLRDRFAAALERAEGRLEVVSDLEAARRRAEALAEGGGVAFAWDAPDEEALRAAAVGVDRADVLVASTGTVGRAFASSLEARTSLVPATAVFVATPDALVDDLPEALARLGALHRRGRAYTVLVTGPSRTADIEKRLVIPAHGPRALVVLLVEEAAGA